MDTSNWSPKALLPKKDVQVQILEVLRAILGELQAIREATETEAVEDAEPNPFQTLNGPIADRGYPNAPPVPDSFK